MMSAPEKRSQDRGMPGWLELYDLTLHKDMEAQSPKGSYIKGMIKEGERFFPTSEILGRAIQKPENIGQNSGWVELETRRFHSDIEAVAPHYPYVKGTKDQDGHFYPNEPYTIISTY